MLRCTQLAAFCLALAAVPVAAEEVSISEPLAAATLREGPLDMVAYFTPADTSAYAVTATFAAPVAYATPMRVVMRLEDGDSTNFALPGYRGATYSFSRSGDALTVSVAPMVRTALAE